MSRLTSILAVALFIVSTSLLSGQELPKDGIHIKMDNHDLTLTAGQAEAKVSYLRSKRLRKVKLETPSVQALAGLEISIVPIEGENDTYLLTVKSDGSFVGPSTLMIDGVGRWGRETKSTSFTVSGGSEAQVSKNR